MNFKQFLESFTEMDEKLNAMSRKIMIVAHSAVNTASQKKMPFRVECLFNF